MKLTNAIKKLEKAGYEITTNGTFYSATLDGREITFTETIKGETSKFSCEYKTSCSATYGLTLKMAMN